MSHNAPTNAQDKGQNREATPEVQYAVQRYGLHGEWDTLADTITTNLWDARQAATRWADLISYDDRLKIRVVTRTVPAWKPVTR